MNNLNYGIIGNCRSGALVSAKGDIDWLCLPDFDSPSIFGAILDQENGGHFRIKVSEDYKITQTYIRRTNLLRTRFESPEGSFDLIDFMPRYRLDASGMYSPPDLIRFIKYRYGTPTFQVEYSPKLEYAYYDTETHIEPEYIKSKTTEGVHDSVYLYTSLNKQDVLDGNKITLQQDEYFLLSYHQKLLPQTVERYELKMERTKVYWLNWSERIKSFTDYNSEINRSALALKLLTYDKTGAVLAALTTSLPETIGEQRNWDYRFCWIRDGSMVVRVMSRLGKYNQALQFLKFVQNIVPDKDDNIQIMYGIHGEQKLTEKILPNFSGYKGSKPVRIGNDAYHQQQNDIYGLLMDVIYQQFSIFKVTLQDSEALWTMTRSIVNIVKKHWQDTDCGLWELRNKREHFTFSKVMCWVAIDRAIKIAQIVGKDRYANQWIALRQEIKNDIEQNAWNDKIQAYTQYYGGEDLDASTLLMEYYDYIEADNPRFVSTVRATERELMHKGLMYRYKNVDDFGTPTSSFTVCTFWMIQSLLKIGDRQKAELMFMELLSYSNHLGLFSEDLDFETKEMLGNFPQAYSHLALIETALNFTDGSLSKTESILEAIHDQHS